MEIKRTSLPSASIEQAKSTDTANTPKATTTNTGISRNMKDSWHDFVSETAANGGAVDPNALVQSVIRESYLQTTEDLRFYADKVKFFNESKKEVRDHLEGLRDADPKLKADLDALQPGQKSNVFEVVATVIKESVQDTSEDKEYYLKRIQTMNTHSQAISDYMEKLVEKSNELATKKKDDDD